MDDELKDRSNNALNIYSIATIQSLLQEDSHYTISELCQQMAVHVLLVLRRVTIHRILSEQLGMSKVSARWVLRNFTDEHRTKRMDATLDMLMQYNEQEECFQIEL